MKKNFTLMAMIFSFIALVGTGFASWVITRPTEPATTTGSVVTQGVSDKTVGLTIEYADGEDGKVIFGSPKEDRVENWLENGSTDYEKLAVVLDVTVENVVNLETDLVITFDIISANTESLSNSDAKTNYEYCVTKNYIAGPTLKLGSEELQANLDGSWTVAKTSLVESKCTLTLEFSWGCQFNGINPLNHYNSSEYSEDLANEASTCLSEINTKLSNVAYKVTVSA